MNKADLVNHVSARTDLTKTDVAQVVDALIETIIDSVVEGKKVSILGFGSFEPRERSARQGLNPKTGEKIKIEAKRVPAHRATAPAPNSRSWRT
ncbi:MAG: HU family DNA-binding protein [Synechococcaceae bacterium WB4_1_0192]|nr:HU family DNA-binding protein [Synechococcaceae bacterium WB4_1_0192]